ncbi:DUF1223 domain-containing protein [Flavobacterium jejuense]|uniref:DUF1223 domain-containing protein n=1 Tax=Flavobacterium jejuense TaxID=1544455 RepID=A0ABX0IP01_9FLAO|nr:DUF1223 domain-containing protein [Flavobacterium jejuense]NHN25532.1 DUF1223 domain-containing protein [Flavobacterium jejuense]
MKIALKIGNRLLFLFLVSSFISEEKMDEKTKQVNKKGFVVLELFTSQGCSSYPPADKVLEKYALQDNSNSIPLAFHVDYWNYLGWKDPFSKAKFTTRQHEYAVKMESNLFTPQLIINGKYELIGSKENEIQNIVLKELTSLKKEIISIDNLLIKENSLKVDYSLSFLKENSVVNIVLVKKKDFITIKRGENKGLQETNYAIVYDLVTKPVKEEKESIFIEFKKEWSPSNYKVVVYLQSRVNGEIFSVTQKAIN